jgi:hypothetical protein
VQRLKAAEQISLKPPVGESHWDLLQVYVVFTDLEATRAALKTAIKLTRDLNAKLVLLIAKIVPWPLPLEAPPVSGEFTERVLSELTREQEADITPRVYLCRDRDLTISQALKPESVVVIGSRRFGWLHRTPPLARVLRRDGHEVILAGIDNQPARVASVSVKSSPASL